MYHELYHRTLHQIGKEMLLLWKMKDLLICNGVSRKFRRFIGPNMCNRYGRNLLGIFRFRWSRSERMGSSCLFILLVKVGLKLEHLTFWQIFILSKNCYTATFNSNFHTNFFISPNIISSIDKLWTFLSISKEQLISVNIVTFHSRSNLTIFQFTYIHLVMIELMARNLHVLLEVDTTIRNTCQLIFGSSSTCTKSLIGLGKVRKIPSLFFMILVVTQICRQNGCIRPGNFL